MAINIDDMHHQLTSVTLFSTKCKFMILLLTIVEFTDTFSVPSLQSKTSLNANG